MAEITFHGGVKDIGGNQFLVEDKGTKIFMQKTAETNAIQKANHLRGFTVYLKINI